MGNFGELTAVDGDLELTAIGTHPRAARGNRPRHEGDHRPGGLPGPLRPLPAHDYLQDLTVSPDGPSVAQVMEELYPQAGGLPVDGVIIVDPVGWQPSWSSPDPSACPGSPSR